MGGSGSALNEYGGSLFVLACNNSVARIARLERGEGRHELVVGGRRDDPRDEGVVLCWDLRRQSVADVLDDLEFTSLLVVSLASALAPRATWGERCEPAACDEGRAIAEG